MRRHLIIALALLAAFFAGSLKSESPSWVRPRTIAAQNECQTFPETGKQVCGIFLSYWKANGGLAQQGFPISDVVREVSSNGQTYDTQYFERAVFERHPENAGTRYEVLLALLGSEKYKARYGEGGPKETGVVGERVARGTTALTVANVARDAEVAGLSEPCQAKAGYVFLTLEVVEENIGTTPQDYNRYNYGLKDNSGLKYDEAGFLCTPEFIINSGELAPGEKIRGTLRYEIRADAAGLVLEYSLFSQDGTRIRITLN